MFVNPETGVTQQLQTPLKWRFTNDDKQFSKVLREEDGAASVLVHFGKIY